MTLRKLRAWEPGAHAVLAGSLIFIASLVLMQQVELKDRRVRALEIAVAQYSAQIETAKERGDWPNPVAGEAGH